MQLFNNYYEKHRSSINLSRLERAKAHEYVIVLNTMLHASKKSKKLLTSKDFPNNVKVQAAFDVLKYNPDGFFKVIFDLSNESKHANFAGEPNVSNASNLGLNIENSPTKTTQYIPREHTNMWKHIERTRGPH
jgi:hypothetical protein